MEYDLRAKRGVGPSRPTASVPVWTAEEEAKLLRDYIEVSREHWPLLEYGTAVCYRKTDGTFNGKAIVRTNPSTTTVDGVPHVSMGLQRNFSKFPGTNGYWELAYHEIEALYAKYDARQLTMQDALCAAMAKLNSNNRKLVERINELEAGLAQLTELTQGVLNRLKK